MSIESDVGVYAFSSGRLAQRGRRNHSRGTKMPIRNVRGVLTWLKAHHHDPEDTRTPEEKALWYFAYRDAIDMYDSYTAKDWVEVVLGGLTPLTLAEKDTELAEFAAEDLEFDLTDDLKDFWGVG